MATFFFEDMTPAEALAYNAATDTILIRTPSATAQQFSISFVPFTINTPDFIIVSGLGKSLTFNDGWDPLESTCRHASLSIL